jgi:hypothetical protein
MVTGRVPNQDRFGADGRSLFQARAMVSIDIPFLPDPAWKKLWG